MLELIDQMRIKKQNTDIKNENAEDWQTEDLLPTYWQLKNNRRTRPKLHDNIEFTVDGFLRTGQVKRVGKVNGKDKTRCWINEGDVETSYDFINDIEHWRTMKKNVTFSKGTAGTNITASNDNEEIGVMHLKSLMLVY